MVKRHGILEITHLFVIEMYRQGRNHLGGVFIGCVFGVWLGMTGASTTIAYDQGEPLFEAFAMPTMVVAISAVLSVLVGATMLRYVGGKEMDRAIEEYKRSES